MRELKQNAQMTAVGARPLQATVTVTMVAQVLSMVPVGSEATVAIVGRGRRR